MKNIVIKLILLIILIHSHPINSYGNPALSPQDPVQIISYGIYELVSEDFKGQTSQNIEEFGYPRFIEQTDKIPAKLGTRFGFSFAVFGLDSLNKEGKVGLRRVIKHPPIKTQDGKVTTGHEYIENYEVLHGAVVGGTGYLLEKNEELVPGKWTFEYWLGDSRLLSKSFEVFAPST